MRRTKFEAGKTRQHILDTALVLFDEQGYLTTSLSDIAQSAGLTRGAIYWHFRNKSAIFAELGELYCGALFTRIREAIASEQTWMGICDSFSEFFDGLEKNARQQRFARILQIQCDRHAKDGPIKQLMLRYQDTWDALVREAIARAVATGELPAKLDQTWAFLLLSCTMAGVMSKYAGTHNSETIRRYAGAIIRATLALIEQGEAYPPIHCK